MCIVMNIWLVNIIDKVWKFLFFIIMFLCGKILKKCFQCFYVIDSYIYKSFINCNKG